MMKKSDHGCCAVYAGTSLAVPGFSCDRAGDLVTRSAARQEFAIPPPGKSTRVFLIFLGAFAPIAILALVSLTANRPVDWLPVLPAMLMLPLVATALAWSMQSRRVWLEQGFLYYRKFRWQRVPLAALELDTARVINLDREAQLQPVSKIAGAQVPGYRAGRFRLRDRRRAYVILTDWSRVLLLPKRDGSLILLSVERADALLDALRRHNR